MLPRPARARCRSISVRDSGPACSVHRGSGGWVAEKSRLARVARGIGRLRRGRRAERAAGRTRSARHSPSAQWGGRFGDTAVADAQARAARGGAPAGSGNGLLARPTRCWRPSSSTGPPAPYTFHLAFPAASRHDDMRRFATEAAARRASSRAPSGLNLTLRVPANLHRDLLLAEPVTGVSA